MTTTRRSVGQIAVVGQAVASGLVWQFVESYRLSLVIKATFVLRDKQPMVQTESSTVIEKDCYHLNDPTQSLVWANELLPYKPKTDVVLIGRAHCPYGKVSASTSVRLALFDKQQAYIDKTVHVYGDRSKQEDAPRPFVSMPLTYERAYGGIGYAENPVGVGADDRPLLPNLFAPEGGGGAACFGPISKYWHARRRLVPSAVRKKLKQAVPELNASFDWNYFQTAPLDQRVAHLRGKEWLVLEGVHPEMPRIQTRLPGAQARIDVLRGQLRFTEPVMDTLSIDTEKMTCTLVWRAMSNLPNTEAARDVLVLAGLTDPTDTGQAWEKARRDLNEGKDTRDRVFLDFSTASASLTSDSAASLNETTVDEGLPLAMQAELGATSLVDRTIVVDRSAEERPSSADRDALHETFIMDGPPTFDSPNVAPPTRASAPEIHARPQWEDGEAFGSKADPAAFGADPLEKDAQTDQGTVEDEAEPISQGDLLGSSTLHSEVWEGLEVRETQSDLAPSSKEQGVDNLEQTMVDPFSLGEEPSAD